MNNDASTNSKYSPMIAEGFQLKFIDKLLPIIFSPGLPFENPPVLPKILLNFFKNTSLHIPSELFPGIFLKISSGFTSGTHPGTPA